MKTYTLCSLLFETTSNYENNLQILLGLIDNAPRNSLIVSPEVCLTGFDYNHFSDATDFTFEAIESLKKVSYEKIIVLTVIEKINNNVFNMLKVIHNGKVVHQRAKARLFKFAGEDTYFSEGDDKDILVFEVDGIKIAALICFELRFKELWQRCEGADIIVSPSWWGVVRTEHFKSFTKTLAIMNQCYVVASDSLNVECSKMSAIINPQGEVVFNENQASLELVYSEKEIRIMRRYMDVGIKEKIGYNNKN